MAICTPKHKKVIFNLFTFLPNMEPGVKNMNSQTSKEMTLGLSDACKDNKNKYHIIMLNYRDHT